MTDDPGLAVGERAPNVSGDLVTPDGEVESVALDDLLTDGPVLLCFYTADFSPDCVEQWCAFRDFDWFASGDAVQVVGVSKSGVGLHRRFIDRLDLTFPMFSDPDLEIAAAFDVVYRALGIAKRSRRSCFLLDQNRTVRYRWLSQHWLDPTRDVPPVDEIYESVRDRLDVEDPDTFGF
ncbi:peroxiredoxin [Halorubrum saccharovorum DSM 1137]|uniref:thioredoxin-dependent peroxiredoxin n=1 Tax=Halorubrum saccharovorum DSM 1137 TaxID=1227484 RepID=M0DQY3_9EURY|nr:redoxin domain-containing protein [Halorubrum saccharovorum]ELZ37916.1 peroxiredoxin [Halorubrum saccharovorum DSM 1137]